MPLSIQRTTTSLNLRLQSITSISERIRIQKENNDLRIKVYEERLPLAIVERARRSAGLYKTQEEIDTSSKIERDSMSSEGR